MDEKRKAVFVDNFSLPEGLVQMAYDKIRQELEELGNKSEGLEISVEMALFNVLGVISGETDIWTIILRADFATNLYQKFDPFTGCVEELKHEEVKKIANEISDRWY